MNRNEPACLICMRFAFGKIVRVFLEAGIWLTELLSDVFENVTFAELLLDRALAAPTGTAVTS